MRSRCCGAFSLAAVLIFAGVSAPALASDGVLEINQTCALQTGCFAGDAAGFPVTIDSPAPLRSFRLTSGLLVPDANTTAISIATAAANVSLDLGGFEIRGPNVCSGSPTTCALSGAGAGVSAAANARVENGSVVGMGGSGVIVGSDGFVRDLRVSHCGGIGIVGDVGATIVENIASINARDGILAFARSVVRGNTSFRNQQSGIVVTTGVMVVGNTAFLNALDGISCSGPASTVFDNTAYSNFGDGIQCSADAHVRGNTVGNNGGFGLFFLSATAAYAENVITGNLGGTVSSGVDIGNNSCNGSAVCP